MLVESIRRHLCEPMVIGEPSGSELFGRVASRKFIPLRDQQLQSVTLVSATPTHVRRVYHIGRPRNKRLITTAATIRHCDGKYADVRTK